jgi:hypothetical protein
MNRGQTEQWVDWAQRMFERWLEGRLGQRRILACGLECLSDEREFAQELGERSGGQLAVELASGEVDLNKKAKQAARVSDCSREQWQQMCGDRCCCVL